MYDELVKRLRNCAYEAVPCNSCASDGDPDCVDKMMHEAADAVEELTTEVEALKHDIERYIQINTNLLNEPKWIPVTERLPQETQRCIVVNKCGEIGFAISTGEDFMLPYFFGKPTHWMPLPEQPKEE